MVSTGDGRDEALVLQTKQDGEVEFRGCDRGGRQPPLGGVLQVRADVSKVDEDHGGGVGIKANRSRCNQLLGEVSEGGRGRGELRDNRLWAQLARRNAGRMFFDSSAEEALTDQNMIDW